jgi:PLP dependent protein
MSIADQLKLVQGTISGSCKLIAVSKTHPPNVILEAYAAGQKIFGENKVQELLAKYDKLPADIEWHLIGHLQTNKVKYIAPFVSMIQSVDSLKLLVEINKQATRVNRVIDCLLQVHIAKEETKFGFSTDEVKRLLAAGTTATLHNVRIVGLMGIATLTDNEDQIRNEFKGLKDLFDHIKNLTTSSNVEMKELSMGMSSDYRLAMEEGSTMVRIGSAIFGRREYQPTSQ